MEEKDFERLDKVKNVVFPTFRKKGGSNRNVTLSPKAA